MTTVGATSLAKMYSQRLVLGSQTFISTFNCPSMVSIPVLKCSLKLAQQDSWYHQDRWKPLVSGRKSSRPDRSPSPSLVAVRVQDPSRSSPLDYFDRSQLCSFAPHESTAIPFGWIRFTKAHLHLFYPLLVL